MHVSKDQCDNGMRSRCAARAKSTRLTLVHLLVRTSHRLMRLCGAASFLWPLFDPSPFLTFNISLTTGIS